MVLGTYTVRIQVAAGVVDEYRTETREVREGDTCGWTPAAVIAARVRQFCVDTMGYDPDADSF